ncbi:polysaccharide biosynthesis protein [Rugamonas sp. FT82W]|uniref:Polysaccharide biosynthesis protein n=1 Tax=Duganella vulcania TaxID=2692166 RepID=A0A845G4U6_9BURK|nr:polysaccharide biosynthesis protein [Duganella vulcania]
MIPKKIHYCWFGGKPLPVMAQRCIASWKQYAPEYEIILWNESNSDIDNEYCRQAARQNNYAFISDWVRFDVLARHGGVYFDTDIELIKPLSTVLTDDRFSSAWESKGLMGAGFIAAVQHDPIMQRARQLILENLIPIRKFATAPRVLKRAVDDVAGDRPLNILAPPSFYPFNPFDVDNPLNAGQLLFSDIVPETVGIHHYASSWTFKKKNRWLAMLTDKLQRQPDWRLTLEF